MNGYVIGVDGGGTKTHYALFDTQGNLVEFLKGGAANHEVYPDGYEGARSEITGSVSRLLSNNGIGPDAVLSGIFGLAGVDIKKQHRAVSSIVAETGIKRYSVMNDAYLGIKAGTSRGRGICVINGTGSACAGIDGNGRMLKLGGTGEAMGDDSGSCNIGRNVIKSVYDSIFRLGRRTLMREMLFERLGIACEDDFEDKVYEQVYSGLIKTDELGRIAFLAANLGDEAALDILRHTGDEMALTAAGMINLLDFSREGEVEIVLAGSANTKGENPTMVETFKHKVGGMIDMDAKFILLDVPPVAGAVLWAFEGLNTADDGSIRGRVSQALLKFGA